MSEITNGTVVPNESTPAANQEANAGTQHQPQEVELGLDDLLGINGEVDPLFTGDANYKGQRALRDLLPHLPIDVRKNLANIQSSFYKKTNEVAELRKQLEAEQARIRHDRELLINSPFVKNLEEMAKEDPNEEIDIWTKEGMAKLIERETAKKLHQSYQPLREAHEREVRQAKFESFKQQHPDIVSDSELRVAMVEEIAKRTAQGDDLFSTEDAYYLCKARLLEVRQAQAERDAEDNRLKARQGLLKTSTGTNVGGQVTPKFKNAYEAFQYHKARLGDKAYTKTGK